MHPKCGDMLQHASGVVGTVLERRGKSKRPKVLVLTTTGLKVEWFVDKCKMIEVEYV